MFGLCLNGSPAPPSNRPACPILVVCLVQLPIWFRPRRPDRPSRFPNPWGLPMGAEQTRSLSLSPGKQSRSAGMPISPLVFIQTTFRLTAAPCTSAKENCFVKILAPHHVPGGLGQLARRGIHRHHHPHLRDRRFLRSYHAAMRG